MSKQGQILRGKKWYNFRDAEGNLPKEIKNDANKMCDVEVYLETIPKEKSNSKKEK